MGERVGYSGGRGSWGKGEGKNATIVSDKNADLYYPAID